MDASHAKRHVRNDLPRCQAVNPIAHLHVHLRTFSAANPASNISCIVHFSPFAFRVWTHLSDKDGLQAARAPRASACNPSLGVAMRDHNTNYSKGSTEPARMMTPFLASNPFGSIESNSINQFLPVLELARTFLGGLLDRLDTARTPHLNGGCLPVGTLNFVKVHDATTFFGLVADFLVVDALQTWREPRGGPPGSFRLLVLFSFCSYWLTARQGRHDLRRRTYRRSVLDWLHSRWTAGGVWAGAAVAAGWTPR